MESLPSPHEATSPGSSARQRKLPMAISVVSVLLALEAVLALAISAALLYPLVRCHALRLEALDTSLNLQACLGFPITLEQDGRPLTIVPLDLLPDLLFFLGTGVVLIVLLFGFRRQRRWAWVGLTAWAGLNLLVALFRYFTISAPHGLQYIQFALNSLIVLALNMEDVQRLFGLRQPPPARAVRQVTAATAEGDKP